LAQALPFCKEVGPTMRGSQSLPTISRGPYAHPPVKPHEPRHWGQSSLDKAIQLVNAEKVDARNQAGPGRAGTWTQDSLDTEIQRLNEVREVERARVASTAPLGPGWQQDDLDAAILHLASMANKCAIASVSVAPVSPAPLSSPYRKGQRPLASSVVCSPVRRAEDPGASNRDAIDAEIGRLCRLRMAQAAMNRDLMPEVTLVKPTLVSPVRTAAALALQKSASAPAPSLGIASAASSTGVQSAGVQWTHDEIMSAIRRAGGAHWAHDEIESAIHQTGGAHWTHDEVEVAIRRLQQSQGALGTSPSSPGARSVRFAGSPSQEGRANDDIVQSTPPAKGSLAGLCSASKVGERPLSPWATSSSAYGAHSSAASSSSTSPSSNASPARGRARLDAARLRTLAIRPPVR